MPSKSKAQQRLMAAAEHGASFPMAKAVRASMTLSQLGDFARGSMAGKPAHVKGSMAHGRRHPGKNLGAHLHPRKAR